MGRRISIDFRLDSRLQFLTSHGHDRRDPLSNGHRPEDRRAPGHRILYVKNNQPGLAQALPAGLDDMIREKFNNVPHGFRESVEDDHGRIETRGVWATPYIDWVGSKQDRWAGLRSVAIVEAKREVSPKGGRCERGCYISTLDGTDAQRLPSAARGSKVDYAMCSM